MDATLTSTSTSGRVPPTPRLLTKELGRLGRDSSRPNACLDLFQAARRQGCQVNVYHVGAVANSVGRGGDWAGALDHLLGAVNDGIESSIVLLNTVLSSCAKQSQWAAAGSILETHMRNRADADTVTCNAFLTTSDEGDLAWCRALAAYSGFLSRAVLVETATQNALSNVLVSTPQWPASLVVMKDTSLRGLEVDVITYSILAELARHESRGGWAMAVGTLDALAQEGLAPDAFILSAVLASCEVGAAWVAALQLLSRSALGGRKAPDMDAATLNAAARCCNGSASWRCARDVLVEMALRSLRQSSTTINGIASAFVEAMQWSAATAVLADDLWVKGIAADSISCATAINSCQKAAAQEDVGGGHWAVAAAALFEAKEVKGRAAFGAAIASCEKASQWEAALRLLASMGGERVERQLVSCNAAASACEKAAQWEAASEVLELMAAGDVVPDVISWSAMGTACQKAAQWEEAIAFLRRSLRQEGCECGGATFNPTLSACEKAVQWVAALRLSEQAAQQQSMQSNEATGFNALLSSLEKAEQWRIALDVYGGMQQLGVETTCVSFGALVSCVGLAAQWSPSLALLGSCHTAGVEPSDIVYNSGITATERGAVWRCGCSVLMAMHEGQNLRRDEVTAAAVIQGCLGGSNWRAALWCCLALSSQDVLPDIQCRAMLLAECEQRGWRLRGREQELLRRLY
eukprot:TRINITY_DN101671_c0_g1_i1.p1 TRINITY_DN101671_c0_g1~~TRINITY_DN101671_c0_g1_i1.p1  ORF type:complete len:695 (-),score=177.50 TRINITY_DN101671_c0_g1_i1:176-2260(-)